MYLSSVFDHILMIRCSAADLTPIPIAQTALASDKSGQIAGLRGRVEQQVDAITGSANKVISGVVDSGFGVLRALLPLQQQGEALVGDGGPASSDAISAPWNAARPGFGLLRRQSGFSIASLAASLPGRERARSFASSYRGDDEAGQEMVESRPGSVRSMRMESEEVVSSGQSGGEEDGDDEEEDGEDNEIGGPAHDTRSIRSFESMYSTGGKGSKSKSQSAMDKRERMSISDRLASMSRLTKGGSSSVSSHPEIAVHHVCIFHCLLCSS